MNCVCGMALTAVRNLDRSAPRSFLERSQSSSLVRLSSDGTPRIRLPRTTSLRSSVSCVSSFGSSVKLFSTAYSSWRAEHRSRSLGQSSLRPRAPSSGPAWARADIASTRRAFMSVRAGIESSGFASIASSWSAVRRDTLPSCSIRLYETWSSVRVVQRKSASGSVVKKFHRTSRMRRLRADSIEFGSSVSLFCTARNSSSSGR
eukprot:Amastigsp_a510087_46.p2 type:complete len:204 gc:universal Amastigsp_a510087_46:1008-397(-)